MSSSIALLSFVGGSSVRTAHREVEAEDAVARSFSGCRTPLARAALDAARGNGTDETASPKVRENLTALWLRDNYAKVFETLVSHLSSKMPLSRQLSVVEDHVQTALARFVERDVLAPFLSKGKNVKLSVLRVWTYHSASTELRRWGVDASTRTTRGAKTYREVRAGDSWRVLQSPNPVREVVRNREDSTARSDLHDPSASSPEDTVVARSRVERVRHHLAITGRAHLIPVMDGLIEGRTLEELSSAHGLSIRQITTALQELRA